MISNRSIRHIDKALTGSITPGHTGPVSNGNEHKTLKTRATTFDTV